MKQAPHMMLSRGGMSVQKIPYCSFKRRAQKENDKPKTIHVSCVMAAKVAAEKGGQVDKKASSTPKYDF